MPDEWDGKERRMVDDGHCGAHEQNTKDIAATKNSLTWIKWAVGLVIPAVITISLWVVSNYMDNVTRSMEKVNDNLERLNQKVEDIKVSAATDRADIRALNNDVNDIKIALRSMPDGHHLALRRVD